MNEFREGTYTPQGGTELSTPQGGIENNPDLFPVYRGEMIITHISCLVGS